MPKTKLFCFFLYLAFKLRGDYLFLHTNSDKSAGTLYINIVTMCLFGCRNFPDYYYNLTVTIPDTSTVVEVVMTDTVMLCGNTDDFSDAQPLGAEDEVAASKQWTWLENTLKNSKYGFIC